jgi:dTDP-4-dehydrorhamnose reductase
MKILVTGKNGQLGKSIHKIVTNNEQTDEFVFVGREELDLNSTDSITSYFNHNNFDIIINCAAHTAVDKAEEEAVLANQINHLAVAQLAQIAKMQQAKLIHVSTDYVFDGESDKPYTEADATSPINIYGKTKLAGEQTLKEIMPTDAIIIRTSWVYSEYGNNFVKTMLRLGKQRDELSVVGDQIGSPTYATDLANAILGTMQNKAFKEVGQETQVYHYSNAGEISWYEFAKEIFELESIPCVINPITTDQYPTPAKRPKNTLMGKDKITETFGVNTPDWTESIQACIKNIEDKQ